MDRRSFIKVGGTVAATGLVGSCGQVAQKIIPYAVPPDEGINPVEGWFYNTACRMCSAGCGVMIRVVEGRAKKVEGNPSHPVNRGGVCARGQASVQQLYHPERLTAPMKRDGAKGTNKFLPITWDEALALLSDNAKKAKGSDSYVMSGDATGMESSIAAEFIKKLGSDNFVVPGINGRENYVTASSAGMLPYYDFSEASFVVLLGADIFENGFSPVHHSYSYGQMRSGDITRRGQLVYAGPRMSMTAASADHFLAVKHGKLGVLALGLAHEALKLGEAEHRLSQIPESIKKEWHHALEKYDIAETARETGLPEKSIHHLAIELVEHPPAVVIPGDDVASHTNGVQSLRAVEFLNTLLREMAGHRQVQGSHDFPAEDRFLYSKMKKNLGIDDSAMDYSSLKSVVGKAANGDMRLGILVDANPIYDTPKTLKVADALSKTDFVAQFTMFLNDSSAYADVILPSAHFLESWSAQVVDYPNGLPIFNTVQPVINPAPGPMQAGDVLIQAAAKAGVPLGYASQEAAVKGMVQKFSSEWKGLPKGLSDRAAWESLLQKGGWWHEADKHKKKKKDIAVKKGWPKAGQLRIDDPKFAGGSEFNFHFHPYSTVNMGSGNVTNLSWLMEMPEPMTTLSWGSWVEINPKKAAELGIDNGDILKVESPYGSIEAPAFIYPGIGPETVALPLGYGHDAFGKDASGRGANPVNLIGDHSSGNSEAPAWRGIRVKVTKTGKKTKMVREGHPEGEYVGAEVFQL